jgi:hypothetical protein
MNKNENIEHNKGKCKTNHFEKITYAFYINGKNVLMGGLPLPNLT